MSDQVTLVLSAAGSVLSVWASREAAEAHAAAYNADAFVDGEPDTDAPYRAETWRLRDAERSR